MFKRLACLFLLCLQAGWAFAQTPVTLTATVLEVDSSNYPKLRAYLRVYDRDRFAPLNDLTLTDIFADTDTGEPLRVLDLALSSRPLQVVAIADLTGSVSQSEVDNQKAALQRLAVLLRPTDELALLAMDHEKVETIHPLSTDKNTLLANLDALTPRGEVTGNVYWDGVQAALALFPSEDRQKVIIILTDISSGGGTGQASEETIINTAIENHIHIFGLYFDYEGDGIPTNNTPLPTEITTLSEATGGIAWGVTAQLRGDDYTDDEALPNMMQTLVPLILSEYELTLEAPLAANGESQGLNITINYGSLTLPPLRTSFTAGENSITLEFSDLTDQQTITLPFTTRITANSTQGQITRLSAFAIREDGQREQLADLDPAAPTLNIPQGALPSGFFRLLIEAEDSGGNRQESDISLIITESLSVTLGNLPQEIKLGETLTLEAQIGLAGSVNTVELFADGETVATQDLGPFDDVRLEWQPPSAGDYTLELRATDILENTASQTVILRVIGETDRSNNNLWFLASIAGLAGVVVTVGTIMVLRRRNTTPQIAPPSLTDDPHALVELQSHTGQRWTLSAGVFTLGRHGSNNIQILDETVSRQHGIIEVKEGRCTYQEGHASHPTELNGRLLEADQHYELQNGDQLRIGSTLLKFKYL